jgi:PAS domain S-box-containing protein
MHDQPRRRKARVASPGSVKAPAHGDAEEQLRAVFRTAVEGIIMIDEHGMIESVNPAATRMFGYKVVELVGRNVSLLMASPHRESHDGYLASFNRTGKAKIIGIGREVPGRRKDGSIFPLELAVSEMRPGGRRMFVGFLHDITARRQAEHEMRESRERLAGIVNSAMDAIISLDAQQRVVMFNAAAERMFGCPAAEALGCPVDRFIPARFHEAHAGHIRQFGKTGVTNRDMGKLGSISGLRADGSEFPVEASISQIDSADGKIYTVILRDVTERRRLEDEVLRAGAEEARRIGQELHDDLGQRLSGTSILGALLSKKLAGRSKANAELATTITKNLVAAAALTRMLARGLVPTMDGNEGLATAFRNLAANVSETSRIECRCECEGPFPVRNHDAALHLYRIAQEAISNAIRHARPTRILLILENDGDATRLVIRDNGTGMNPQPSPGGGLGLRNMRYRAEKIGATLEIRPGAGSGSEVICRFPADL